MALPLRVRVLLVLCVFCVVKLLHAQLPFYTDDPSVTEKGKFHFEFFNEFDSLQHPQYPNLQQNTANYKSFYVEFPTGDARNQLGSGLTDYWLNFIAQ